MRGYGGDYYRGGMGRGTSGFGRGAGRETGGWGGGGGQRSGYGGSGGQQAGGLRGELPRRDWDEDLAGQYRRRAPRGDFGGGNSGGDFGSGGGSGGGWGAQRGRWSRDAYGSVEEQWGRPGGYGQVQGGTQQGWGQAIGRAGSFGAEGQGRFRGSPGSPGWPGGEGRGGGRYDAGYGRGYRGWNDGGWRR